MLVEDLASLDVVVLGPYGLLEQTPPDAARSWFEEAAQAPLEELAAPSRPRAPPSRDTSSGVPTEGEADESITRTGSELTSGRLKCPAHQRELP